MFISERKWQSLLLYWNFRNCFCNQKERTGHRSDNHCSVHCAAKPYTYDHFLHNPIINQWSGIVFQASKNSSLWTTWSIWPFLDIFSFARKTWRAKVFSWRLGNLSARAMQKCDVRLGSTTHGVHICHLKHTASQVTWRQRRPIFRGHFMDSSLLVLTPIPTYPFIKKNFPFHYLFAFYFTQMGMNSTFCFWSCYWLWIKDCWHSNGNHFLWRIPIKHASCL